MYDRSRVYADKIDDGVRNRLADAALRQKNSVASELG
jgi:hypothetical protein